MALNHSSQIMTFFAIRRMIGYLAILLPLLVYIGAWFNGATPLLNSVSAYYYTNSREIFVGILVAKSLLLYIYKGYSTTDNHLTNLTSLLALIIALFPTLGERNEKAQYLFAFLSPQMTDLIHLIAASAYFFTVACITYFIFTKTGSDPLTPQKIYRNGLYRVCGLVMFVSIFIMGVYQILPINIQLSFQFCRPIFLLETLFLLAFGLSWMVKGGITLRDRE